MRKVTKVTKFSVNDVKFRIIEYDDNSVRIEVSNDNKYGRFFGSNSGWYSSLDSFLNSDWPFIMEAINRDIEWSNNEFCTRQFDEVKKLVPVIILHLGVE